MALTRLLLEVMDLKKLERIVQIAKELPKEKGKELLENVYGVVCKAIELGYDTHTTESGIGSINGFSWSKRRECDEIRDYLRTELETLKKSVEKNDLQLDTTDNILNYTV